MKSSIAPILAATVWISISEFIRNSFVLKRYWAGHYQALALTFPEQPVNGAIWGIWSLCLAVTVYLFSKRYSLVETTFLAWFVGFVMMWLVVGNLGMLPFRILPVAIPLSLVEVYVASLIIQKLDPAKP